MIFHKLFCMRKQRSDKTFDSNTVLLKVELNFFTLFMLQAIHLK